MTGFLTRWLEGKPRYTREARFAGHMYPDDEEELARRIDGWLDEVGAAAEPPLGLIVPFGDLEYAGPVAAAAWGSARAHAARYDRVLLLGSAQRIPFRGPAIAGYDAWRTPLGDLRTDADALNALMKVEGVRQLDEAHAQEASLELVVPFAQRALPKAKLVPMLMGDGGAEELTEALGATWGPGTLAVVVTELSREEPLEDASARDARTSGAVLRMAGEEIDRRSASARVPLRALLEVARGRGARVEECARGTSADADGRTEQVIGYGAFALYG